MPWNRKNWETSLLSFEKEVNNDTGLRIDGFDIRQTCSSWLHYCVKRHRFHFPASALGVILSKKEATWSVFWHCPWRWRFSFKLCINSGSNLPSDLRSHIPLRGRVWCERVASLKSYQSIRRVPCAKDKSTERYTALCAVCVCVHQGYVCRFVSLFPTHQPWRRSLNWLILSSCCQESRERGR